MPKKQNKQVQRYIKTLDKDSLRAYEIAQEQLRRMEAIAEGNICLEQALLLSVVELVPPCGRCDRCNSSYPSKDWSQKALALLSVLEDTKGMHIHKLVEVLSIEEVHGEQRWGWLARRLVQEELIKESNDGSQRLSLCASGYHFLKEPWRLNYVG